MKTPIQELIEIIKKRQEDDEAMPFMYNDRIIKLAESMLEKEKEVMNETWDSAVDDLEEFETFEDFYNETFNNEL